MSASELPFLVKALDNFPGKEKDELVFKKGVLIAVFEVDTINERYRGEIKGGKVGWFPNYYVKPEPGPVPEVKFLVEQDKLSKREEEIKKKKKKLKKLQK